MSEADRGAVTSAFVHDCRFPGPVRFELVAIWWPGVQRSCRWILGQPRGFRMGVVPSRQSRGRPGFRGEWTTTCCFTIGRPRRANRAGSRRRSVRRPAARRLRRPRPPARSCTRDRPRRPRRMTVLAASAPSALDLATYDNSRDGRSSRGPTVRRRCTVRDGLGSADTGQGAVLSCPLDKASSVGVRGEAVTPLAVGRRPRSWVWNP